MLWAPEVKANEKLKVKLYLEWEEIYEKMREKNLTYVPVWSEKLLCNSETTATPLEFKAS